VRIFDRKIKKQARGRASAEKGRAGAQRKRQSTETKLREENKETRECRAQIPGQTITRWRTTVPPGAVNAEIAHIVSIDANIKTQSTRWQLTPIKHPKDSGR
jgi:hypothetical protein